MPAKIRPMLWPLRRPFASMVLTYGPLIRAPPSAEFLFPHILNELRNQDAFVFLLSPASISSPWIDNQLDVILERRGVEIIPALLKPCPVPRSLADRTIVDLGSGVQGLVDCLEANARIDLRALSSRSFESLTLDLLRRLYFDFDEPIIARDHGYDFRGIFRDSLGFADPVEYLIEVKSQKDERSSVNALQAFANVIASDERLPHGLLVTNSQLTSVAAKALIKINEAGYSAGNRWAEAQKPAVALSGSDYWLFHGQRGR